MNKTVTDFVGIYTDIPPSLRPWSPRMDVGEMHTILNKIDKLEAILFAVQTSVYIVRMIIVQANAAAESNGRVLNKTNRVAQNESECSNNY